MKASPRPRWPIPICPSEMRSLAPGILPYENAVDAMAVVPATNNVRRSIFLSIRHSFWISVLRRMGKMRVIGGEFRSRRLKTLPGLSLRPTPDRLRQALFNVLGPRTEGAIFLDAYAGSGAVGIEALSRGAARAIFLEKHAGAVRVIRENLASLGVEDRAVVVHSAAVPAITRYEAD